MTTGARDQIVSIQIAYDKTIAPVPMNEIQGNWISYYNSWFALKVILVVSRQCWTYQNSISARDQMVSVQTHYDKGIAAEAMNEKHNWICTQYFLTSVNIDFRTYQMNISTTSDGQHTHWFWQSIAQFTMDETWG